MKRKAKYWDEPFFRADTNEINEILAQKREWEVHHINATLLGDEATTDILQKICSSFKLLITQKKEQYYALHYEQETGTASKALEGFSW
jgi:hypothetical protein